LPETLKKMSRIVLVMGVSGSGKSTIAETIATNLGGDYLDADPFHPPENIAKMKQGAV
jgi:gluconokinase